MVNTRIWSHDPSAPWETAERHAGSRPFVRRRLRGESRPCCLRHTTAEITPTRAGPDGQSGQDLPADRGHVRGPGHPHCLPHSHGSQGCCAYHRSTLTRHYKEPVMAATSSFTEGSSVFGGQANLLQAIQNIFTIYSPDVIAVHTTCLSETIGDDIPQIIAKARDEKKIPAGQVRHPRQHAQLRRLARHRLRQHGPGHGRLFRRAGRAPSTAAINLIPGWVEPADMREIKRLAGAAGRFRRSSSPTRPTCSTPRRPASTQFYPKGGMTDRRTCAPTGASQATFALGPTASEAAAQALGDEVQGALRDAGAAHRPAGHRPLHRRPAPVAGVKRARRDHRGARPAAGHDHRHAPVLLRQARGPVGRSRPARLADRVPRRPRHAARLHRHRHAGQAIRTSAWKRPWPAASPRPRSARVPAPTCSSCTSGSSRSRSTCSSATPTASTSPATRTFPSCGTASRSSTASGIRTSPRSATAAGMRLLEKILDALLDRKDRGRPGRELRAGDVEWAWRAHASEPDAHRRPAGGTAGCQILETRAPKRRSPWRCEKQSVAGSVSQRACVFCGSRVVLYPIADAVHLVHGPVGCAAYTWDIRGALSSGPELHRMSFSTDLREKDVIFGGEEKLYRGPGRAHRPLPAQGGLRLLHLHRRPDRRRRGGRLPPGGGRDAASP